MEQLSFDFEKVEISEGDIILFRKNSETFSFTNEAGFTTKTPPPDTYITTESFGIAIGVGMPECAGPMRYENGEALFLSAKPPLLMRLLDGDIVRIVKLPPPSHP